MSNMRLCVSAVLVLLLALTRAGADPILAAGSEECSKLDKLRTITDRNEVVGRFYFMAGYIDNNISRSFLELTNSFWGDMTLTKDGLYVEEYSNMNGTCVGFRANISVHGDTAKSSLAGMSGEFKLHNFSRTLFIMDLNTTMTNASAIIQSLHLDPSLGHGQDTITAHCYYLISREREVSEPELQLFKERAKCEGFTGEPAFVYKSDQEYCTELDSLLFNLDPECINLDKLDTIADKTQVVGPFYFMAAFTDNDVLSNLIRLSTSIWGEITLNEAGLHVQEFSKMKGTCVEFNVNVTRSGDLNKAKMAAMRSEFKFRNFTSTSRIMDVRLSSPNILPLLESLHIDPNLTHGQSSIKGRGYYLISTVPEVNEADIRLFRKYAKCADFPDEPVLLNKGDKDYCPKEGALRVP